VWSNNSKVLLNKLISSIGDHQKFPTECRHVILLQNWNGDSIPEFIQSQNHIIDFLTTDKIISLSKARNRMLERCKEKAYIQNEDIVAFPDDDCWYPNSALSKICDAFAKDTLIQFLFCKYKSEDHDDTAINTKRRASIKELVRSASSNTIFLKGILALKIGGFDRHLGVGAPNNGGEDLDYSVKAYLNATQICFSPLNLIGHRNKDNSLRGKYFRGSTIVLRRYAFKRVGFFYEYIRKILIGCLISIKGEMSASELIIATKYLPEDSKIAQCIKK
jgi:hypothetical protein